MYNYIAQEWVLTKEQVISSSVVSRLNTSFQCLAEDAQKGDRSALGTLGMGMMWELFSAEFGRIDRWV